MIKEVKVISREGSGYGQSVNECMDIARGEYIGLVESDDKVDKNMYETLYNIAKDHNLDWVKVIFTIIILECLKMSNWLENL